jgi:hypothetical protein
MHRTLQWAVLAISLIATACDYSFALAPAVDARIEVAVDVIEADSVVVELGAALRPGRSEGGPWRTVTDPALTLGAWTVFPDEGSARDTPRYEARRTFDPGDPEAGPFLDGLVSGPVVPPSVSGFPGLPIGPIHMIRREGLYNIEMTPNGDLIIRIAVVNQPGNIDPRWSLDVAHENSLVPLLSLSRAGPPPDSMAVPAMLLGECSAVFLAVRLRYRTSNVVLEGPRVGVVLVVATTTEWKVKRRCDADDAKPPRERVRAHAGE